MTRRDGDSILGGVGSGPRWSRRYAWGHGDLTGAPIPTSNGHLTVLVGFDSAGNPVINDPAAASDEDVQRTYSRAELETLWLQHSGGTVYAIYPAGWPIPR